MRRIFGDYMFTAVMHDPRGTVYSTLVLHLPPSYAHDPEALLHQFDAEWFLQHCDKLPDVVFDYVIDEEQHGKAVSLQSVA